MSVSALIMSPVTRELDLFQAAVLDAGVMVESMALPQETVVKRMRKIAKNLGCPSSGEAMLTCLRKIEPENLVDHSHDLNYSTFFTLNPSLDGNFLPASIAEDMARNADKYMKIPIIIGTATNEGSLFVRNSLFSTEDIVLDDEDDFVAQCMKLANTFKFRHRFNKPGPRENLLNVYFNAYDNKVQGASDFIAHGFFVCPVNAFIKHYSRFSSEIYLYRFDRPTERTYIYDANKFGSFHGNPFLHFMGTYLFFEEAVAPSDREFATESVELLTDFAKTLTQPSLRGVPWPDYAKEQKLLEISEYPEIVEGLPNEMECEAMFPYYYEPPVESKEEL